MVDILNNKVEIGDIIVYPNFSRLAFAIYIGETDSGYIKMSYGHYRGIELHTAIAYRKYANILKVDMPKANLENFYERYRNYKESERKRKQELKKLYKPII